MSWIKGIIGFLRAVINAPETKHWIDKYEVAKKDNTDLRREIQRLKEEIRTLKKSNYFPFPG